MSRQSGAGRANGPIDLFVSYSPADEQWATWIAGQLETAGHRAMLQAWDFVPGTNFVEFMDRGLSRATAVIAVLSRHYANSTYGRLEWQATLRADPGNAASRLIPVRVEECPLEGLLATITYIDLVGVTDPGQARTQLLSRVEHAIAGRAKREASYPQQAMVGQVIPVQEAPAEVVPTRSPGRRAPGTEPVFPAEFRAEPGSRSAVTVLQIAGPRFGRGLAASGEPFSAEDLQSRIWADVVQLAGEGLPKPDLMVVTGDLTESGSPRECETALQFLTGLRALAGLEPHRLVIVPGGHDITMAASHAYFSSCEADDLRPQPPYWPKWRHFAKLFEEFYRGLDGPLFEAAQPWTLFAVPEMRVVVAGLNSTMASSHRQEDRYGWIGEAQAAWFAERLRAFERNGWLRIGVISHDPAGDAPAGRDTALLRDAGTLDRLLGPRLNILLHGPGPGGTHIGELGSGLVVVPAAAPGRHQYLRLTPDGLERWGARKDAADDPERLPRRWHMVDGTFNAGSAAVAGEDQHDATPAPEPDRAPSPVSMLLDQITEVCEARHEHAKIRRVDVDLPHVLITEQEDGFIRRWRVAAHVGEPDRDVLDAFAQLVHAGQYEPGSELVYQGPQPPRVLRDEAARRGVRVRSFIEFQGLLDLRGYVAAQTARLAADPLYPPDLYVPQRFRELDRPEPGLREDLVEDLLAQVAADHGRFVLVLGDFGRGKTFALHEVARRIPLELPHLVPLLIELRALDKAHSVDGLVAAHLANHGEDLIDLKAFRYMLRQGRIVLLFDGFDELVTRVTYERAADHLETLLPAAEGKAKVVVASRTQHFKSHEQVLTALGERLGALPSRRVLAVEDFTPAQIRAYLVGRYGGDEDAADRRLRLLGGVQDLLGLSRNPRMLSFIADLDEQRLHAVVDTKQTVSAAGLYAEILRSWLEYEENRTQKVAGTPGGLKSDDLWHAVTVLAMRLWETGETFLRQSDLTEVGDTLSGLAAGRLTTEERVHAVGAGSLLARTDQGLFGFIHASVVEWLVAAEIARQLNHGVARPAPLAARPLSQLTVDFVCDLAGAQPCQAWAGPILADPAASELARANEIKVSTRLRTPAEIDLRGALLKGEDLSYRELAGVDLTGADLSDARLAGTNLAGATLRDANLSGARLDEARLAGADMRGADLTRARMARADLRGAKLAGSRWVRAGLVDVKADPGLAAEPELRGAAITPGQPVQVELAPAAIGVPFGFHFQTTRLPESIAYSGDGGLLAIGTDDGGVVVCDTITGQPVRTLHGHSGRVYGVAFADGVLATGSSDGRARLWDPATGECLQKLAGHQDGVWPMTLSPGGDLLATGDGAGLVRLWDVAAGTVRHVLPGHSAPVYTAAFSPDGALLAVGDTATVRLYDTATGKELRELGGHHGPIYRAVFSPAGDLLATGDHHGTVRLWEPGGTLRHELAGHTGRVYAVAVDPQGSRLASCDTDGLIRLWDSASGKARHQLAGHRASVWPMVFRPDGRQLATTANDGSARLWDPVSGQPRHVLRGHGRRITQVRFSPDGGQLASTGNDGVVRLWQPRTGQQLRPLTGPAAQLISVLFSPAGERLAAASNDGGVYLWNTRTGSYEREMNVAPDHLWAEAFSPDGNLLATANDDDTVRLWYCTTGRRLATFR